MEIELRLLVSAIIIIFDYFRRKQRIIQDSTVNNFNSNFHKESSSRTENL